MFTDFCQICNKTIKCDNQDLPQLMQHAGMSTYRSLVGNIAEGEQVVLQVSSSGQSGQQATNSSTITAVSHQDQSTKAELIWAMKVVSSGYSYSSCDGIIETLSAMFPGAIPNTFTMSLSKVSYLISEATGLFFHGLVVSDIKVDSGHSVTAERAALSEASINGLRSTRDGLKLLMKSHTWYL